jgi:hypothetical protein
MRHLSSRTHQGGTIPPKGLVFSNLFLEIIMKNAQAADVPALPEVEEVSAHEVEDELLKSSYFCDVAWILFSSNAGEQAVLAA